MGRFFVRCIFVFLIFFLPISLGFLLAQPWGEWKGLFASVLFYSIIYRYRFEILLMGLGAKKKHVTYGPRTQIFDSSSLNMPFVYFIKGRRVFFVFRDDLVRFERKRSCRYYC